MGKFFKEIMQRNGIIKGSLRILGTSLLLIPRNIKWFFYMCTRKEARITMGKHVLYLPMGPFRLDLFERSIQKQLILDGIREMSATTYLLNFLKSDDVILELGANLGYYVLQEKKIVTQGYIYALEPDPTNFTLLTRTVEENKLKNIDLFPLAVSNKPGNIDFYLSADANRHNMFQPKGDDDTTISVKAVTADAFLKGKKRPTLIRMDVEGAEGVMYTGMLTTLARAGPLHLFVELHPHISSEARKGILSFLKELQKQGFESDLVITHDTWFGKKLGLLTEERLSIDDLLADSRVLNGECALEVFFSKK